MKKTITMNLSGIIFHIEEDAFEKLSHYLQTIKGYFKNAEGCDEIMNDIESRIAEMLHSKVSTVKQAVVMADVESVIAVMGKPEEFAGDSADTKDSSQNKQQEDATGYTYTGRRRIFRDPDDKIVGGVCSGIANYFDFDPIWLRAAFAIAFFAFGTGLLLYIVLLIIIPKAKTTAEKLEMRGEKVDVNNIGKAVNEEFQEFRKKMNDLGKEMQSRENKERMRSGAQKGADFLKEILYRIFKGVAKAVSFLLILVGVVLMVALLATLFGRGVVAVSDGGNDIRLSLYEICAVVLPDDLQIQYVITGLLLFLGIPLLSMIYGGTRCLFDIKRKNKIVKYAGNLLWFVGLGLMVYVGIKIGADFTEQSGNKQQLYISQPAGNALYLDLKEMPKDDERKIDRHYSHNFYRGDWALISKGDNTFSIGYPRLDIVQSQADTFELFVIKTAQGFDKKDAANRAKNIEYKIVQTDSLIEFNNYFDIHATDKIRAQDVKLVLKVPVGKTVFLSKRMEGIIYDIDNVTETLDSDMVNRRWKMTQKGLECVDCQGLDEAIHLSHPPPPPVPPSHEHNY
ncbi:MAG: PspC domain-containing protein [Bacteroidia bacterium]